MKFRKESLFWLLAVIASVIYLVYAFSETNIPTKAELESDYQYIDNVEITKVRRMGGKHSKRTHIYVEYDVNGETVETKLTLYTHTYKYRKGDTISGYVNKSDNKDLYTEIADKQNSSSKLGSVAAIILTSILFVMSLFSSKNNK